MSAPEKAFGNLIRKIRQEKGLSQEALALEAGLDRTFISLLERGSRQPSLTTIFKIAKVLGISASTLISKVESSLSLNHDGVDL
ncbi:helix-turn-helix transcriptional regulator [Prosthecochloris sp.]|uniref:helix-turn-helix domain-containing protein n=1 Tax=Prosthecochloris sp. TaxID=290513 RepID=UPI0025FCA898|nr:helix-turn-helix transcriptional regulator [Prosthecochloris sp.]